MRSAHKALRRYEKGGPAHHQKRDDQHGLPADPVPEDHAPTGLAKSQTAEVAEAASVPESGANRGKNSPLKMRVAAVP